MSSTFVHSSSAQLLRLLADVDARVVEEDVDAAEIGRAVSAMARSTSSGTATSAVTTSVAAPVAAAISAAAASRLRRVPAHDHDRGPRLRQPPGDAQPDPSIAPRHDGDLACKSNGFTSVSIHGFLDRSRGRIALGLATIVPEL